MTFLRNFRCFATAVLLGAAVCSQCASQQSVRVIRICGHGHRGQDYILTLVKAWQTEFQKTHPDIQFQDDLDGDASAIGSLFTNTADLAILDREASFIEVDAYQQGSGHDPFRIPVARGSVSLARHAPALVVYVNPSNPLAGLTLQQVDGIFDADHRLGDRTYINWGDLGLPGDWADKPIHLYAYFLQSAQMQFFERAAMKGSQKFNCCLTVFHPMPGSTVAQQITAALAHDKYGLAVLSEPEPDLKPVPLSAGTGQKPVLATAETVSSEVYPLGRTIYIYANRKPGSPLPSAIAEFLAFVVSPQGQVVVARSGGYLPLSDTAVESAKELLR
jgi:phosphate transport system substrate-binding protein